MAEFRTFTTGATRDLDENKLDFEGFESPLTMRRFAEYMNKNRKMRDGSTRASDNWQKGIPLDAYMKSGWRHFFDWWLQHRGNKSTEDLEESLCAVIFNARGYLHELLRIKQSGNHDGGKDEHGSTPLSDRRSISEGKESSVDREVQGGCRRPHLCTCEACKAQCSIGDATGTPY